MTPSVEIVIHLKQGSYMAIPLVSNEAVEELAESLFQVLSGERAEGVFRIGTFPNLYVVKTEDIAAFEVGVMQPQYEEGEEWKAS